MSTPNPSLAPSDPPGATTTSLDKITPPKNLGKQEKKAVFEYIFRQLARFRNTASLHAQLEVQQEAVAAATAKSDDTGPDTKVSESPESQGRKAEYDAALTQWAQNLLRNAWVCVEEDEAKCPVLDGHYDTSIKDVVSLLPSPNDISQLLNTILFLHITTTKQYSALTRAFLFQIVDQLNQLLSPEDLEEQEEKRGDPPAKIQLNEDDISWTLKNPETALEQAQKQADTVAAEHAARSKTVRNTAVGLGGIAGGILVGITGGLAAPLVGAAVAAILGVFGIGGTILGLLTTGLAGSGVICGTLFGVYGATVDCGDGGGESKRDSGDGQQKEKGDNEAAEKEKDDSEAAEKEKETGLRDTLAVRLCISGWLNDKKDVTAPWTVFEGDDTYALQWEIEALEELSNALTALIHEEAFKYVKGEILKRTFLAALMASMAPLALLKIGQIIDNPWMNARARGIKAGAVLGDLLAQRVLGNRPVTLVGYSLGSLVIYEALLELASRPPAETLDLVQDVYLFGAPVPADRDEWAKIRRVVAGRVVNGYSDNDYVLAVLSRAADARWNVAGLEPVDVKGVENVSCSESFLGGLTIPIPVHALTLLNGNVFGISGFCHRAVKGNVEGVAGAAGLVLGGSLIALIDGKAPAALALPLAQVAASGFLVGLGTKLSNGCTSGGAEYLAYQLLPLAASFVLYIVAQRIKVRSGAVNKNNSSSKSIGLSEESALLSSASSDTTNATKPNYYEPQSSLRTLAFFTTSVQFALALQLSSLTEPIRVISFLLLPLHKAFDPSLAFLAAGALPLAIALYRYGRGSEVPVLGGKWGIPKGGPIDLKLLAGAAIFGVGWGMAGVCPGPGLINLGRALAGGANASQFAVWLAALVGGGLLA
ncbi:hypothetical protein H1R20_g2173, partial [Candolleomyces eurysporus]